MDTPEDSPRTDRTDRTDRAEHRMERRYEISATPEQVWDAVATAGGISSWMVPTQLDPRAGGTVVFDFGDMSSTGVVTAYEPGRRFAYEEPWPLGEGEDELPPEMADWFTSIGVALDDVYAGLDQVSPIATEFLIEAASGGSCVLRVVTSAYGAGADWENEFFAQMNSDWVPMLDSLAARLSAGTLRVSA